MSVAAAMETGAEGSTGAEPSKPDSRATKGSVSRKQVKRGQTIGGVCGRGEGAFWV